MVRTLTSYLSHTHPGSAFDTGPWSAPPLEYWRLDKALTGRQILNIKTVAKAESSPWPSTGGGSFEPFGSHDVKNPVSLVIGWEQGGLEGAGRAVLRRTVGASTRPGRGAR